MSLSFDIPASICLAMFNVFYIFIGFVFLGVLLAGLCVVIIACLFRKWKLAGWLFAGTVGVLFAMAGGYSLLFPDIFVRSPVPNSAVIGSYHLDPNWADGRLAPMGYKDKTGNLALNADGHFAATRIPAALIHGYDETSFPRSGGYYQLSGTWDISKSKQSDSNTYEVELYIKSAELTGQLPNISAELRRQRSHPAVLEVDLIKGKPLLLGFRIFNGDFDDVLFLRDASAVQQIP